MNGNKLTQNEIASKGTLQESQEIFEEAFLNQFMRLMSKALYDWEQSKTAKEKDG
ncbi:MULTISPECIES: hypothetical protein [Bacillus cereus group]|uniref:hypothetical protein n=1 Tax=Bacillus cereus group TaxID=86661 RepID=UPI000A303859|nr:MULTISPECIES: hypothetical protein [Bacillus cereus group]MDA1777967.1 hypothetical protein [Bacillus cereus group sp. BY9-3LC]MDA1810460.1 hypothetical protein [Bacillus cereus]SMD70630.1 hypothetical protein BACERE00184_00963 [Bacillus cereus]BCC56135.1 hypothetical protein BCJMU07_5485 [Bacillus cereus]HDR8319252.1 hypothetical protein [Bacillus cereus]